MHSRLFNFLEKFYLLTCFQYGFSKNHTTEHAVVKLVSNILDSFEKKKFFLAFFLICLRRSMLLTISYFFLNYLHMESGALHLIGLNLTCITENNLQVFKIYTLIVNLFNMECLRGQCWAPYCFSYMLMIFIMPAII